MTKTSAVLAFVFAVLAAPVFGDSIAMLLENDCLFSQRMFEGKNSDDDYTHGTGIEYWYRDEWRFLLQ